MEIDKIYVISLDGQVPELQQKILKNLQTLNFESTTSCGVYPAWDGKNQGVPEGYSVYKNWQLEDTWNDWWKREVIPGEVGCAVSHIKVWEKIVAKGLKRTLILEDDFHPNGQLNNLDEPPVEWDIAYLGKSKIKKDAKEESIGGSWVKPVASYCMHAYIVTLEGAKKLLNEYKIKQNLIPIDEFLIATYTEHRRPDIKALFPPKIKAIATADEDFISQKRKQEDSTIEVDPTKNPNLMKRARLKTKETEKQYFEVLDESNWDAWKEKYLHLTTAKGEWDLIVDDLRHNVYEFPLFTERFCKEVVALAETQDKWTVDRHSNYPTNDVLLEELGLNAIYNKVLHEVVRPLCIHLWKLKGPAWDKFSNENFMARYTMSRQSHLALHHDRSHLTLVVKLNDEFDGGGTWFPKYNLLSNPKRIGTATIHPGMITHQHGARPIYEGKRYIAVSFIRTHNEP